MKLNRCAAAFLALAAVLGLQSCATGPSKEQQLVSKAVQALGGAQALADVRTISWKGNLKQWEPEQSDVPGGEMRFANESQLEGFVDVQARAARTNWVKNFAYPAPRTFTYSEIVTPTAGYVMGIDSNGRNADSMKANPPAHTMSGYRLATSHREGLRSNISALMLAMLFNPEQVKPAADIAAQPAVSYQGLIVAFDPQTGLPTRIRTLDYDNIWGDVNYDMVPSDWKTVNNVKIAMNRKTELNGRVVGDFNFTDLRINQAIDGKLLAIPAEARAGAAKPASGNVPYQWVLRRQFIGTYLDSDNVSYDTKASQGLRLQEVSPGVHHVVGGSHNSLIVEMSDFLVIFDAPVTDAQSAWVMSTVKSRFPGKPVRWVVLTHHHMDHTGGVRGLLVDGGTLVVGAPGRAHFQKVLAAPMTRNTDLTPRSFVAATQIMEVTASNVITDSRGRQVMMYVMDNPHAKGMMIGWVPDAKLGFVTDIWTPGPPLPAKPNPGLVAVVTAVQKAGIQPERFAGGHGGTSDYASLARLAGQ